MENRCSSYWGMFTKWSEVSCQLSLCIVSMVCNQDRVHAYGVLVLLSFTQFKDVFQSRYGNVNIVELIKSVKCCYLWMPHYHELTAAVWSTVENPNSFQFS